MLLFFSTALECLQVRTLISTLLHLRLSTVPCRSGQVVQEPGHDDGQSLMTASFFRRPRHFSGLQVSVPPQCRQLSAPFLLC